MGSRGKLIFDLNEPPAEDDEENDKIFCSQPQKALPSANPHTPELLVSSAGSQGIINNNAFSHASSVSGFQPFSRAKAAQGHGVDAEHKAESSRVAPSSSKRSKGENIRAAPSSVPGSENAPADEREEGEWSDTEGSVDAYASTILHEQGKASRGQGISEVMDTATGVDIGVRESSQDDSNSRGVLGSDQDLSDQKRNKSRHFEGNAKGEKSVDGQEEPCLLPKQREIKGTEAIHAIKCANNLRKRKIDQQKEAMLGKKRNRQTVFLKLEDVKQVGSLKTSTPRRHNPPIITRTVKEVRAIPPPAERGGEKQSQAVNKDQKQYDISSFSEGGTSLEASEPKPECNGDMNSGLSGRPRRLNSSTDFSAEASQPPIPRQSSWKQPADTRQLKNSQFSNKKPAIVGQGSTDPKLGNKKHPPAKKPTATGNSYQDTSVERLIREVTNEKFWHHPEESELQCVPGRFESVEEYVRVFEPLLFEECRAQLYSTWEELTETGSRDTHVMVHIKNIERRERGWYDVIVLPVNECKWSFKEGDVAVLSTPRPGSVRGKKNHSMTTEDDEEPEVSGHVAGTVRRHIPIDTRDPLGAIIHFYVGDSYDPSSMADDDHILRKLQPKGIWYLTVLGSLATTQREYVALHAFCRLNSQMQTAILKPSPEHFPKYEHQTPTMPECITQNFIDHLRRSFNGPQLAAIQWAAIHTAAGTSSGLTKSPWPFTLVQGPPGTGKTHTVWGMLNVIHLVQYQHYYNSLLKKLAPESYKQANDSISDNVTMGSIDEVLQNMDHNLLRTLPKLCPKPRMLVCAPSNAATDELLSRVLDRGFIDGEMKVYRPDVARVGVDSQTRAAQAVSVERRTEQLLLEPGRSYRMDAQFKRA